MQRTIRLGSFKKFKAAAGPLAIRTWHWRGGGVSALERTLCLSRVSLERETRLLESVVVRYTYADRRQQRVPTLHLQTTRHLCRLSLFCDSPASPHGRHSFSCASREAERTRRAGRRDVVWPARAGEDDRRKIHRHPILALSSTLVVLLPKFSDFAYLFIFLRLACET